MSLPPSVESIHRKYIVATSLQIARVDYFEVVQLMEMVEEKAAHMACLVGQLMEQRCFHSP